MDQAPIEKISALATIETDPRFAETRRLLGELRAEFDRIDFNDADRREIEDALALSMDTHIDEADPPDGPYVNHILRTVLYLVRDYGVTKKESIVAMFMHDSVENRASKLAAQSDTPAEIPERDRAFAFLQKRFGKRVRVLVGAVTNPEKIPGVTVTADEKNRAYAQHVKESIEDPDTAMIKLSDFTDNTRIADPANPLTPEKRAKLARKYLPVVDIFLDRLSRQDIQMPGDRKERAIRRLTQARTDIQKLIG